MQYIQNINNRCKLCHYAEGLAAAGFGGNIHCQVFKARMENKDGLPNNIMIKKDSDGLLVTVTIHRKKRQCQVCRVHRSKGLNLNCTMGSGNLVRVRVRCKYFMNDGSTQRVCCVKKYNPNRVELWGRERFFVDM